MIVEICQKILVHNNLPPSLSSIGNLCDEDISGTTGNSPEHGCVFIFEELK
jgi:hypothetical protein